MDKVLSVILPVYNVEEYIERCINSLELQDVPRESFEIIIVNDGSPDNSREVVLRLMNEYDNIVFLEQENKGVSMARNLGIERAIGRYILFVDPDDYVLPNTFRAIIEHAIHHNVQLMYLGYQFLSETGTVLIDVLNQQLSGRIYSGIESYFLARSQGYPDPDRSVSILYDRRFIATHRLFYLPNVPYLEDGEFIARVFCLADSCLFHDQAFYMRTTRPGSATNSKLFNQERSILGFIRAAKNLKQFQRNSNNQAQVNFLNQPVIKFSLLAVQGCVSKNGLYFLRKVVLQLREAGLSNLSTEKCIAPYVVYGKLYNVSPFVFFVYYGSKIVIDRFFNLFKF